MNGMRVAGDALYTCGIDDSVKRINLTERVYDQAGFDVKLASQPRGMDIGDGDTVLTACVTEVSILFYINVFVYRDVRDSNLESLKTAFYYYKQKYFDSDNKNKCTIS